MSTRLDPAPTDLAAVVVAVIAALLLLRLLASILTGLVLAALPTAHTAAARRAWHRLAAPLARRAMVGLLPVALAGTTALPAGAVSVRRAYGPPWTAGPRAAAGTAPTASVASALATPPAASAASAAPARTLPERGSPSPPAQHRVEQGESFWSVAEDHVLTWLDEATERDLARYWVRLVEANTDRLPVPDNPDLLLPGTVLRLPPLPTR